MNNNEESLISHTLKLYGVQYTDNIELRYYSNKKYIEVGDCDMQDSYILRMYKGIIDVPYVVIRNTSSNLNNNFRSFINHWIQYFNFNKTINRVAVRKCSFDTLDIAILCNDNRWYCVLTSPYGLVEDWISYKW